MYSINTLDRGEDEIQTELHQDVPFYEQFSSDKEVLFEI